MKSTTIIYHRADPDGWFSNTVCRHFLKGEVQSIGWDYGDPTPIVPTKGDIYLVDISVAEIMNDASLRHRIVWIDHHKTAIEKWDVVLDGGHYPETNPTSPFQGLRIEGVAACRLCWAWFANPKYAAGYITCDTDWSQQRNGEPDVLFFVGLRDVWKHTGTEHEDHCDRLNLALVSRSEDEELRDNLVCGDTNSLDNLLVEGGAIQRYFQNTNKEHAKRGAMIRQWRGMNWMILNSQSRGSKTLEDHAWPLGDAIDALMVWAVGCEGNVNVSLYHVPHNKAIDLSVIAKEYGGGGHPGACGFRTTLKEIQSIIEVKP